MSRRMGDVEKPSPMEPFYALYAIAADDMLLEIPPAGGQALGDGGLCA